jgi:hypothetical protein
MHLPDFLYPTKSDVGSVATETLSQLKKTRSGLHISGLVNHNGRHHSAPCSILFCRDLAQKMEQPSVMRLKRDGMNSGYKFGVRPFPGDSISISYPL